MVNLVLTIGGMQFSGWQRVNIIRSMDIGPFEFDAEVSHRWKDDSRTAIKPGQAVSIHLDNELLMQGFIDRISPEYDAEQHTLLINGRSPIGDLVDCSTVGKQFKKQTLLQIAIDLCKPFSIEVVVDSSVDIGKPFKSLSIDEGQPIFEFLEQAARIRALRLMSTPQGQLRITRAASTQAKAQLVLGENIRRASAQFSLRNRFSRYIVVASQDRAETLRATDINHPTANATDQTVAAIRHRPLVIVNGDPADLAECKTRAEWQRNTHYGRGQSIVYTVGGWQVVNNGKTWQPNSRVVVNDSYSGIQREWLIVESRLILDQNGPRSELRVMPPEAMQLIPLPEPEDSNTAGLAP